MRTAKQSVASAVLSRIPGRADVTIWTVMNMLRSVKNISRRKKIMSKYFSLVLGLANAVCLVVNIINQKWDILVVNIIACVLCLGNFIIND